MSKLSRKQISENRKRAIALRGSGYWGNPCSRGHSGWRVFKPNGIGRCIECDSISNKDWMRKNKERASAKNRDWYEANKDHARAYSKEWAARNRDRCAENNRLWGEANKERKAELFRLWVEKNKDRRSERVSEWRKKNRGRLTAIQNKRHTAKMNRTIPGFDDEIECIYRAAQERRSNGEDVNVDHIVPLQGDLASGLHVPWNLQIIPADENVRKGNRFEPYMEVHSASTP